MIVWTVDWRSIGINETGTGLAVFLDHRTEYWKDSGLKLDPVLFQINLPFYMESEQWWKSHDKDNDLSISSRQSYVANLSLKERNLFAWIRNQINPLIIETKEDNSLAKNKAKKIHLRSSGINNLAEEKILCNLANNPILVNIAFQDYLIPRQSCFAICDVNAALSLFLKNLINIKGIITDEEKFLIIIDPPWENKSVKRRRNYETAGSTEIIQTFQLLNKICSLLINRHQLDIRIVLWTTEKQKSLCLEQLLPIIEMKLEACLLWHKITNSWESSKVRGGREYLLIASPNGAEKPLDGVFVSKPSAIHSHKPPIGFDFPWLQQSQNNYLEEPERLIINRQPLYDDRFTQLRGIELYARYLRPNFLSIGFECIKLQAYELFAFE
ncbi:N(6)-adenine-specific methyltransferase METTL4-like [Panonychus citri]|uniref:N(6)-adenine-specific methyltransferase METTL4-like n=1 Tax=Panonychus citri TaxID=50023 RepID=UPI002307A15D|nr:N(6)-adenine-specific methyltransferase METTL4-like [Panonychus citri]